MRDRRRRRTAAGTAVVLVMLTLLAGPASAVGEDVCDVASVEVLRERSTGLPVVRGIRLTDLGASCEGVVVGVQFLANAAGDPGQPGRVAATSYSDEDPCTGEDLATGGVVRDGEVEVLLCRGSATADHVAGREFVGMRVISGDPTEVLGGVEERVPPDDETRVLGVFDERGGPLAETGIDAFRAAALGALFTLVGVALVRRARERLHGE